MALDKSLRSHEKQVEEHIAKIINPQLHDKGWKDKDQVQKDGLLKNGKRKRHEMLNRQKWKGVLETLWI